MRYQLGNGITASLAPSRSPPVEISICVRFDSAALYELVAQLVEQRPFKAWVLGSSPSELTTPARPRPHFQAFQAPLRLFGCGFWWRIGAEIKMTGEPESDSPSGEPQLNSEIEWKAALRELVKAYEGLLKQFEETFIQSDLENTEAFRDFVDAWGKFFEKIIVV